MAERQVGRAGCQDVTTLTTNTTNRKKDEKATLATFNDSRFSAAAQKLANKYGEFKDSVEKVVDSIDDVTSAVGESVEAVMGAAQTGVFETATFPLNFSRELCLRLDFIKYDRRNRFETAKVYPAACIILPLPQTLNFGQGVGYNFNDLGLSGQIESQFQRGEFNDIGTTIERGGTAIQSAVETAQTQGTVAGLKSGLSGLMDAISSTSAGSAATTTAVSGGLRSLQGASDLFGGSTASVISTNLGVIPNPHLANVFQGIQPRSFNFRMVLQVSSPEESAALQTVVEKIRKYYLPAISSDRSALAYPHEVNVSFSEAGYSKVNPKTPLDKMFSLKRCVLENMTLDVGADGTPAFFHNLEPVAVTMDLSFREVEISTANDFGLDPGKDLVGATKDVAKKVITSDVVDESASKLNSAFKSVIQ